MTPTWSAERPQVPVDKDGNWMHYPSYRHEDWLPIQPFPASLKIESLITGRSAKYLILVDMQTGIKYPMFITDLLKFLEKGTVNEGRLRGVWTACKRGANYGIKAVTSGSG